jgi:hypothetical protein
MMGDESFQVPDESRVAAESEARPEKLLLRNYVEFVEAHPFEPSPIMFSELVKWRPSPTRQSAFQ